MDTKVQDERRAKRFYISLVLMLFAIQFTIGGIALKLAIGDPALAVVPDYHKAALNWDTTHRASLASNRLGWGVDVIVSDAADARGQRAIAMTIQDKTDQARDDLNVTAKLYRHAQAGDVQTVQLPSIGEGRYLAMANMPDNGMWQLEFDIEGAGEPMTATRIIELDN